MNAEEIIRNATDALREGLEYRDAGQLSQSAEALERALNLLPREPEILYLVGTVAHERGEWVKAIRHLGAAIAARPEEFRYHGQLAQTLRAMGRIEAAEERFRTALRLAPEDPAIRVNFGAMLQEAGRIEEAVTHYRQALERHPELVEAHFNLGSALGELNQNEEAEFHYRATLRLRPEHDRAHYNLGILLQNEGLFAETISCFTQACALRPDYTRARWKMLLSLPILIDDDSRIPEIRARWRQGVQTLLATTRPQTSRERRETWEAASSVTNFYLNYHGQNDREEQRLYGQLLTRVAQACFPGHIQAPPPRRIAPGEKMRVGFVSSYFCGHSIFKTHSRWITGLDGTRFERFVFHTGEKFDLSSRHIQERVEHFFHLPPTLPPESLIET
ncbi:MAG: tetratricopeptide repeat protein, partial [Magnetococcales bacterium]|nr:tetratricopeptide repeat protein [Magnetococcales bacterium]